MLRGLGRKMASVVAAKSGKHSPTRVLGLPGWRTNEVILNFQLAGLKKALDETDGKLKWEIVCIDGANPASGPPVDEIKELFGTDMQYFEWWSSEELENGEMFFKGLDKSLERLVAFIKANGPFQVIAGFSQGGAMMSLLQSKVEQDPSFLPCHLRWNSSVYIGSVEVRDHRFKDLYKHPSLGSMCPTIHLIGDLDVVKARSESLYNHFNSSCPDSTFLIRYPEIHQPPTWRSSKDQLLELAEKLRHLARPKHWWAFDFDGVLCDSARETCLSGIRGGMRVLPQVFTAEECTSSCGQEFLVGAFLHLRPLLEHGYHSLLLSFMVLCEKKHTRSEDSSYLDIARLLEQRIRDEGFEPTISQIQQDFGVNLDDLKNGLHSARNEWIQTDFENWLDANQFYSKAVQAVAKLCERGEPVYIITTKHKDFAVPLLAKAGLRIPDYRVYGQGMGSKEAVINDISKSVEQGKRCFFIEDRVDTLVRVAEKISMPTTLAFASWGYNDSNDARVADNSRFLNFTEESFEAYVHESLDNM